MNNDDERDYEEEAYNRRTMLEERAAESEERAKNAVRITVTLEVDVDLREWSEEYGTTGAGESLTQALADLRDRDGYLHGPTWVELAKVHRAKAVVDLDNQPRGR